MSDVLRDKRILFFAPAFFNYEKMIAEKLEREGATVDFYDERSIKSALGRAILKICPSVFNRKTEKYYDDIIEQNKGKDYDYILIIKCDMITGTILAKLRENFPNAKMCLYLYDSIRNIIGIEKKFSYFDIVSSFDFDDCETHQFMKFRPLFFGDQFRRKRAEKKDYKYDICFIGTIHSDRYAIIKRIDEIARNINLKTYWFMYLQSKFIYYLYKLTKREFRTTSYNTFDYDKKSAESIAEIVEDSRIILDIQHPKQSGLTMRTIEMIGMNKKIITTNGSIKKYDFYHPNNIAVVNRKEADIPTEFLKNRYVPIDENIYEKYSLDRWISDVLNCEDK